VPAEAVARGQGARSCGVSSLLAGPGAVDEGGVRKAPFDTELPSATRCFLDDFEACIRS
jgi:hypothetical protein